MPNNKQTTNLFASIAAAQTMVEQFPFSFVASESGFTCTFDLLTAIFNLISDEPLNEKIVSYISDKLSDTNSRWLEGIEETVKMVLEANLTNIITCELNPIIPDKLIGGGEFLKGTNRELNFSNEGIIIPISAIDFTNMLQYCPADENSAASNSNYFPCYDDNGKTLGVIDLWKHDDFNAFLWYVKNKGVYGNLTERRKLIWDNRYKTRPYAKYERKPESFFTKTYGKYYYNGENNIIPFDKSYLEEYNADSGNTYKKKQLLECRYIDSDGTHSDAFQFRIAGSNYYKTRNLTGKKDKKAVSINKTIFEFNHDFLMSLKLFDAKTYLCQMINSMLGTGNFSLNLTLTKDNLQIETLIDSIIDDVIRLSDTEIDAFSNQEYDIMSQIALRKRQIGEENQVVLDSLYEELSNIDFNKKDYQQNKTVIENTLFELTKQMADNEKTPNGWKVNYDYQFELIRMIAYPLIRPLFSPKIMTLLLINLEIMGNPLELSKATIGNILPYLMNIIQGVIIAIKDIINEMLYEWVIEKLTPILTLASLRLIMEQIDLYKQLIENMITACTFSGFNRISSPIDNVDYVDIDPEIEKNKTNTNIKN